MNTIRITAVLLTAFCWVVMVPNANALEIDRIIKELEITEGVNVADVGAGEGFWSVALARRVGESGRVYSTEIDPELVRKIERQIVIVGVQNVTVIEGAVTNTNLPKQCCDAILLRRVYHHITNPHAMDQSMFESLRRGGLILVIDFEPGAQGAPTRILVGVPEKRGGHGTPKGQLVEEMSANGFELVRQIDDWFGSDYAILFRRPE